MNLPQISMLFAVLMCVGGLAVGAAVAAIIAFKAGIAHRKKEAEAAIGSAEAEAERIRKEAARAAEQKKKEALLEAKDEIHRYRNEAERELKDRRIEVQRQERHVQQKEEALDRKVENCEKKEEALTKKQKEIDDRLRDVNDLKKSQFEMLERISELTKEQAREYLLSQLTDELTHDKALKILEIENQLKDEADQKARFIISHAIQRVAADQVAESTVSVVPLPSDEMKGRIIGREGRNIRAIETITGVDLIIDDTPEAITLSSFDPVRREIARIALEKLITDGRIHPARIEEMVEKAQREVEATIKQEGERAIFETGVHGIHQELIRLLGRMRYRTSYGQNVLAHSIEVSHIAGLLASELGLPQQQVNLAKRAGLLHDIGKAVTHEVEGSHVNIGVDLARKYREKEEVIHAIEAHHGDVEAKTLVACLVQAADAISAARPGARRENLEAYIKRLERLEELASSMPGVEKCFAFQAGREIRILVNPDQIKDDDMVILARDLSKKIENELNYPGQIKVHVVRETRAVDYAK